MDDRARLNATSERRFALTLSCALLALAAVSLWRGHVWAPRVLIAVAVMLMIAAVLIPASIGPVRRGWLAFGAALSRVTTPLLMGIVYFLVLTPTGIIRRTFGRSPLRTRAPGVSAWEPRPRPRSDLTRQF